MLAGWVALTGTPGVGKSTLADRVRLRGVPSVDLGRFAHDYGLVEGIDAARTSAIVDPARVAPVLRGVTQRGALLLLDGHWSHDVPGVTAAIVLRLDPRELGGRLERKGWPPPKVRENLEAEAIDLIIQEAVHRLGASHVFEIDTTGRPVEAVERDLWTLVRGPSPRARAFRPGHVDWAERVLELS